MTFNRSVTQRERPVPANEALISTTDTTGTITSANAAFCRVAEYTEEELIGHGHNIVRHPDMPPEAFADLWARLKQGKPWMGVVKNRCKGGDHYYVDAYVAPVFKGDQIVGYQSVRTQPGRDVVQRADKVYRRLRARRSALGLKKWLPRQLSFATKSWGIGVLAAVPLLVFALMSQQPGLGWLWLITVVLTGTLNRLAVQPLLALARSASASHHNPLSQQVYTGRGDEVGQLDLVLRAQQSQARTILERVSHASDSIEAVASITQSVVAGTADRIRHQEQEVELAVTAMNEMAATVNEVARNAETTAESSREAAGQARQGGAAVDTTVEDVNKLAVAVNGATAVIEKLKADSEAIGSVVEVISAIAEQTNLLALNAAIEAARAGEQGRGFAVVADEVRNLASRTQESTGEIHQMIKGIQQSATQAEAAMREGYDCAQTCLAGSANLETTFGEIETAIARISEMNEQVATAAEEQSKVSEEINRNMVSIDTVTKETYGHAEQTGRACDELYALVKDLQALVRQFGSV